MFFFPNSPFVRNRNSTRSTQQTSLYSDFEPFDRYGNFKPIEPYEEIESQLDYSDEDLLSIYESDDFIPIYKDEKSTDSRAESESDILVVNTDLAKYLKDHPKEVYKLTPRHFEELIAGILADLGYSIELTAQSADGGIDIFATQKSTVGESLLIVDCKRYAPDNTRLQRKIDILSLANNFDLGKSSSLKKLFQKSVVAKTKDCRYS